MNNFSTGALPLLVKYLAKLNVTLKLKHSVQFGLSITHSAQYGKVLSMQCTTKRVYSNRNCNKKERIYCKYGVLTFGDDGTGLADESKRTKRVQGWSRQIIGGRLLLFAILLLCEITVPFA